MLTLLKQFYETIKYFEIKYILSYLKKKNIKFFFIKEITILFILNIIVFIPFFFTSFFLISFIIFLICNLTISSFLILRTLNLIKNKEKNDKLLLNNSIIKTEFFNLIKDDIFSNQQFGIILSILFFLYQFIVSVIVILFQFKNFFKIIIVNLSYAAVVFLIIQLFLLFYHLKFRKLKYFVSSKKRKKTNTVFKKNKKIKKNNSFSFKDYFKQFKNIFINIKINKFSDIFSLLKYCIPIFLFLIMFITLLILKSFIKFSFIFIFIESMLFSMIFIKSVFKKILNYKNEEKFDSTYNFISFLILSIFILNFLSIFNIKINYGDNNFLFYLKSFINPIFLLLNNIADKLNNIFKLFNLLIILIIPLLYLILFFLFNYISNLFEKITKIIDFKLRKKLTNNNLSIIFGDSTSLYPFLFNSFLNIITLLLISLETLPLALFFSNLFNTFKIIEVFKFYFLNENNIIIFFKFLFYIILISTVIKILFNFISSLTTHLILFNDEIIYYENKIITKTIIRLPLSKINYIIVKQNLIEKYLNIGTLFIETVNKNNFIKIKGVSSIKEKNILIMDKIKSAL